jgi:hypothetical protein
MTPPPATKTKAKKKAPAQPRQDAIAASKKSG